MKPRTVCTSNYFPWCQQIQKATSEYKKNSLTNHKNVTVIKPPSAGQMMTKSPPNLRRLLFFIFGSVIIRRRSILIFWLIISKFRRFGTLGRRFFT